MKKDLTQGEEEEINTAWSFNDVLKKLIWATDYLLHVKDYDGHNHEELLVCLKEAQKYIINNPLQGELTKEPNEEDGDKVDLSSPDYHNNCRKCSNTFWTKDAMNVICNKCQLSIIQEEPTKDIPQNRDMITKQQIIEVLKKHENLRYNERGNAYCVFDIHYKDIASELLALQEKKEEPTGSNFVRITELTDEEWLKHSKEEILQLYKNCHQMLMNYIGLSGEKIQDIRTYTSTDGEPTKDIPDDMIEKYILSKYPVYMIGTGINKIDGNAGFRECLLIELKALQSGEIARWVKENEG